MATASISAPTMTAPPVAARSGFFGPANQGDSSSALIAFVLVAITDILFILASDRCQHWFVIPISVCALVVGTDAIEWLRGRMNLYDPIGIIGLYAVHWFYVAPMLNVAWDFWITDVYAPPDWRDWIGYMGILNALGLILYRLCRRTFKRRVPAGRVFWKIDRLKARTVLPVLILISAVAQTWVYARFGGITAYMDSRLMGNQPEWDHMGPMFMISESAPILIAFLVVINLQQSRIQWTQTFFALSALVVVQMYFGGLRGSRSETVELFFWVVGCIHFLVRPVPRKVIYVGCCCLYVFMYFYAFYKSMGRDAIEAYTASAEDREHIAETRHKTTKGLILGDFGRADVQAYVLYRLVNDAKDFDYAKGRTYLGSLALWVPRFILSERPYTKLKEGTEVQYGSGYDPNYASSRAYGMAVEGMLNFGPIAAPLVYGLLGLAVGWFRKMVDRFQMGDARLLLVPLVTFECMSVLGGDSDNLLYGIAKNGFLPVLAIILCSVRYRLRAPKMVPGQVRTVNSRLLRPARELSSVR